MTLLRSFLIGSLFVFAIIGGIGWYKKAPKPAARPELIQEISIAPAAAKPVAPPPKPAIIVENLPEVDRISQLFALDSSKLPIVETVSYTSRVSWMKGRPAWIADYATYYATSRHFIARSLNRKVDYFTQKVSPGDKFNVFKKDKNLQFHLLIDISRCRMWFYYVDLDLNQRVLLKTYKVGLGRLDAGRKSGSLTPVGKYSLGGKVAIYKPGTMGFFQDERTEMIRVFGTRWIPFESELEGASEPAKGLGIHGAPWVYDTQGGQLVEDKSKLGKYDSDGCVRMASEDMEEIFAIILTKPTTVELVKDFREAQLPGIEKDAA